MVIVAGLVVSLWSAASLLVLALCGAAARGDRLDRAARRTARVEARLRACPPPAARVLPVRGARDAGPHTPASQGAVAVRRPGRPCAASARLGAQQRRTRR
jgi:hypothetical protein